MGQYFDNQNLPSKMVKKECFILGKKFTFFTDNGVFSKDGLDFGSRLLLETIPLEEVGGKVLDMGCGYGVFGIVLNKLTSCAVDMVDVNLRAIHLSEINIHENHCQNISVFESNVYENIHSKYSCIVTNPPIRAGKEIIRKFLLGSYEYLNNNGNTLKNLKIPYINAFYFGRTESCFKDIDNFMSMYKENTSLESKRQEIDFFTNLYQILTFNNYDCKKFLIRISEEIMEENLIL